MPHWQHVHYVSWQRAWAQDRTPQHCGLVSKHASQKKKKHSGQWHTNTHTNVKAPPQGQFPPHTHTSTRTHPSHCTHSNTLTRFDTPTHVMCAGRGTASVSVNRWTAFEPATSVTHPYWWQAEHSLTAQRFSKHSMAPGTEGVNGGVGMAGRTDGWMDG